VGQHGSRWQAIMSVSAKIGCAAQTLNEWIKRAEIDGGRRVGAREDEGAGAGES
jgi:transposase-like protein